MYILKNAVTSIVRNKGRNLLIGIIILVMACSSAITLAIYNSASSLISSYEEQYDIEATLSMDRKNMMNSFNPEDRENSKEDMQDMFESASSISVDDIKNYADSKYVKKYYYTMSVGMDAKDLEQASTSSESEDSDSNIPDDVPKGNRGMNQIDGDFELVGYSSKDAMNEFVEGKYKITTGEVFSDFSSDSCIINSELATLNDISVGDKITLIDSNDDSKTYELTVTGIYEEEESENNGMNMFSNSANTIITNTSVVTKISDNNENLKLTVNPTFILTDNDVVEDFQDELVNKGLSEYLTVSTNLDMIASSTSAISNVSTFAITFLIITIIIGVIVLLVINMINIRERKYEIGVLRTIGMKKSKVALQFMSELIIVALIAILLGTGIGALSSIPVANHLLAQEIEASKTQSADINKNFGGEEMKGGPDNEKFSGAVSVQKITSIDAVVDFKVLGEILVIGILVTLISGSVTLINIERFSPLTILKERT